MLQKRRYKLLWVSKELLTDFVQGRTRQAKWTNFPEDGIVVAAWGSQLDEKISFKIYSETFPIVREGAGVPDMEDPWYSTADKCPGPTLEGGRAVTDEV